MLGGSDGNCASKGVVGMPWDSGLTVEQRAAASHFGSHARLLAGPGTGKTLVMSRHIQFLIEEREVPPAHIVALTFTRAADPDQSAGDQLRICDHNEKRATRDGSTKR